MMAGGECPKWIVVYCGWSKVVSVLGSEGMARGVESGGSYDGGHCSKSRRRQDEDGEVDSC